MARHRPTITAFEMSPDKGAGLARDMRVRWALEEVGRPYDVRLLTVAQMKAPAHLELQPFGQIPTYEDGDVSLFESGAIVLHIAEHHSGLLPTDAAARAKAIGWMFAALTTVEPPILERDNAMHLDAERAWQVDRLAMIGGLIRTRLDQLAAALGESTWLKDSFGAPDILMVHAIRRLESSGILEDYPVLTDYVSRAAERPAYKRAFDAQYEVYRSAASP